MTDNNPNKWLKKNRENYDRIMLSFDKQLQLRGAHPHQMQGYVKTIDWGVVRLVMSIIALSLLFWWLV